MCACSLQITEGEIVSKEFKPEYSHLQMMPVYVGKNIQLIPIWHHYPDRWCITISAYSDKKEVRETFYVHKEVYESVEIGDWFVFDSGKGTTKEPVRKERSKRSDEDTQL